MTRATIIRRFQAPSYYEHCARLKATDAVLHGPHFDVDPDDIDSLRDPFKVARPFAHSMATEMGEAYSWGWFETPEGAVPAVCPATLAAKYLRVNGSTR